MKQEISSQEQWSNNGVTQWSNTVYIFWLESKIKSITVEVHPKSEVQKSQNSPYFELIIISFGSAITTIALSNLKSIRFSSQYGVL
jgi:hypothetical protein